MYTVYVLVDPRNDEIKYVGMTSNPIARLTQHQWDRAIPEKYEWVQELKAAGMMARMEILESELTEYLDAIEKEANWIKYYLSVGYKLFNRGVPLVIPKSNRIPRPEAHRNCSECPNIISAKNASRLTCSDKCRKTRQRRLAKLKKQSRSN